MANTFELSNTYIEQIKKYSDETTPLSKILESSQNILFQSYLSRRKNPKTGYFDEEIAPFVYLRYYIGEGRFILLDLNSYKEGWHSLEEDFSKENPVSSPVLSLLDDSVSLVNNDELAKSLESYPTFTDWFKRLLDKISPDDRKEISLSGVKIKKFVEVLEEEKKKIEKEEIAEVIVSPIIKEEIKVEEKKTSSPSVAKTKPSFVNKGKKETKKVKVKTASFKSIDELEEKKLIASQNKANELSNRIRKKVGIHFGWDELFVYAKNGDEMLTSINKKIRKKGLKSQDNDWIIVATYTVEDEDFELIKSHHPNHTFRSDDILHKPSAEYVSLAIVVSPVKEERKVMTPDVKEVKNKAVSFVNISPDVGYSASPDLDYDDDFEEEIPEIRHPNDGIIRPVKYKGAVFASHEDPKPYSPSVKAEDDDTPPEGTYSNPNGKYGIQEFKDDEEEIIIPKHWKCPFCPSKNPWHTEEPSRIIKNRDGSYTFLCKKHKNQNID